MYEILDVGCGDRPKGDVNCDLFIGDFPHLQKSRIIKPKIIPNFVKCDAHHLPFKTAAFKETFSSHLIEHVNDPAKVLYEMLRVSREKVTFVLPHKFARASWLKYRQNPTHNIF